MSPLLLGVRSLLATVLLLAAIGKLRSRRHHRDFRRSLDGYAFLPPRARGAVAVTVPAAELAVAGLLAVPRSAWLGWLAATALLTCFTAGTGWALTRGRAVRCACFGPGGRLVAGRHLARDLALTGLAAVGAATAAPAAPTVAAAAVAVPAGALLGLLVSRMDDVAALLTPAGRAPDTLRS
ncbi:MauE/DoxX family redox-associated membrane protein [Micromonospora sp. NPDC050686]|uniref:MauE/DoxX family redox-associated membrane protein n=1 Tax=Micromonospora sp. NPDC050686 TaxID=3154631 RepID=UPI0033ECDBC1